MAQARSEGRRIFQYRRDVSSRGGQRPPRLASNPHFPEEMPLTEWFKGNLGLPVRRQISVEICRCPTSTRGSSRCSAAAASPPQPSQPNDRPPSGQFSSVAFSVESCSSSPEESCRTTASEGRQPWLPIPTWCLPSAQPSVAPHPYIY